MAWIFLAHGVEQGHELIRGASETNSAAAISVKALNYECNKIIYNLLLINQASYRARDLNIPTCLLS